MAEADTPLARPLLIPQPHGGALMPPMRPGETRNPHGNGLPARRLAHALQQALDGRGGPSVLAEALLTIALDPLNKAAVPAIREVLDRLDGPVVKAKLTAHVDAGVVRRKVREVDYEIPAQVQPAQEPTNGSCTTGSPSSSHAPAPADSQPAQ